MLVYFTIVSVSHYLLTAAWQGWGWQVTSQMMLPGERWLHSAQGQLSRKGGKLWTVIIRYCSCWGWTYWKMGALSGKGSISGVKRADTKVHLLYILVHIHSLLTLSSHYPDTANPGFWLVTISGKIYKELLLQLAVGPQNAHYLSYPSRMGVTSHILNQHFYWARWVGWGVIQSLTLEGCDSLILCPPHAMVMYHPFIVIVLKSMNIHSSGSPACQTYFPCSHYPTSSWWLGSGIPFCSCWSTDRRRPK